jgi:hypothetical protein
MYAKEFSFVGKHAILVKNLRESPFKKKSKDSNQDKFIFKTYIDIFMVAPLIGVIYNRQSMREPGSASATIFADAFISRSSEIDFLIQLVLLTFDSSLKTDQEKIELAFKGFYDESKQDEIKSIFESYLYGGIELLHETLVENTKNIDEVISNFRQFNSSFINLFSKNA